MRLHDWRRQLEYVRRRLAEAQAVGDTQRATNLRHERERLVLVLKHKERERFIHDVLERIEEQETNP